MTVIEITILIKLRPFKVKLENKVSIMNEFFLLGIYSFYMPIQLTDNEATQYFYGWFMVGLIVMVNIINFSLIIIHKVKECKCVKYCLQRRKRKRPFKIRTLQGEGSDTPKGLTDFPHSDR